MNAVLYNKAINKLEVAIRDCRFIKRTPEAYQRTADNLRQRVEAIATMLEEEAETIA